MTEVPLEEILKKRETRLWKGLYILPILTGLTGFPIAFFIVFFVNSRPEELGLVMYIFKAIGAILSFCIQFGVIGLLGAIFVWMNYRRRIHTLSRHGQLVPTQWNGIRTIYGEKEFPEVLGHILGRGLAFLLGLLWVPLLKHLDKSLPVWSVQASSVLGEKTVHIKDTMFGDEEVYIDSQQQAWAIIDTNHPDRYHFLLRVGDEQRKK